MSASKSEKPAGPIAVVQTQPTSESTKPTAIDPKATTALPNQREAVHGEIIRLLKEEKDQFDNSSSVKELLTELRLAKLYERLVKGFVEKKIALKETASNQKKLGDPKLMQVYVIGLVNNWVKRDPRLNGTGTKKA